MNRIHKNKMPIEFQERLKQAIYTRNIPLAEIERKYGLNHSNIVQYMNGCMSPTCYSLAQLCQALDISADWLLFGEGELKDSPKDREHKQVISHNIITYNGETHTLREWSQKLGIKEKTLRSRLNYGWTVEEAFTHRICKGGETRCNI